MTSLNKNVNIYHGEANDAHKRINMIKIIVDAMGGDNSPFVNVEGAVKAVNAYSDLHVTLVGPQSQLNELLGKYKFDNKRLAILGAEDVITCNDRPTEAIRSKTESSLYKAYELLRSSDEYGGLVSIGSTGAILVGAITRLGRIKGVSRPALVPVVPTLSDGGLVALCDSGANAECYSYQIDQFATMGSYYLEKAFGVKNPRVGLLNIGTEENKGDNLRKETYQLLKQNKHVNFVGNAEARDYLSGKFDLIVCDGFSGNILLKATEGACLDTMKLVKGAMLKNLKTKIGALLLKKDLYAVKNKMDYNNYGGAALLGVTKTVVKGHGSSKSKAVFKCIEQAYNMEKSGLRVAITEGLKEETKDDNLA